MPGLASGVAYEQELLDAYLKGSRLSPISSAEANQALGIYKLPASVPGFGSATYRKTINNQPLSVRSVKALIPKNALDTDVMRFAAKIVLANFKPPAPTAPAIKPVLKPAPSTATGRAPLATPKPSAPTAPRLVQPSVKPSSGVKLPNTSTAPVTRVTSRMPVSADPAPAPAPRRTTLLRRPANTGFTRFA